MQLKFNDMNIFFFAKLDSDENEHEEKILPQLFMLDIFIYIS